MKILINTILGILLFVGNVSYQGNNVSVTNVAFAYWGDGDDDGSEVPPRAAQLFCNDQSAEAYTSCYNSGVSAIGGLTAGCAIVAALLNPLAGAIGATICFSSDLEANEKLTTACDNHATEVWNRCMYV